jgi:filamentous hemagglutinin
VTFNGPTTITNGVTVVNTGAVKLVALGETTASGTGGLTLGDETVIGTLKATGDLKIAAVGTGGVANLDLNGKAVEITAAANIADITSGLQGGSLVLEDTPTVPKITVGATDITVTAKSGGSGLTGLTVSAFSTGAGKLSLPASVVTFTATAGGGKIAHEAAPASLTLSSATELTYVGDLSVTGAVSFAGNLTVTGAASFGTTTDATDSGGATLTFNGATAAIGAYTTKAATNATTFAGSAPLTITTLTDLAGGASKVIFNGDVPATIASQVTTTTGGMAIEGTGGVIIPSASIIADTAIDASAGKVIFGTADDNVTIEKGILASATGLAAVAADGAITLAHNASAPTLVLKTGGSIEITGDGVVKVGATSGSTTLEGAGTFNFTGKTNTDTLTITPTHATNSATITATALSKLALTGSAKIAIPAATSAGGVTLQGVLVDLSSGGSITIEDTGILKLGATNASVDDVAGIITGYEGTGKVVVAGGKAAPAALSNDVCVAAFDEQEDYDGVVGLLSAGVSIQCVITAGVDQNPPNNTINVDDTFALAASSPNMNVTHD